MNGRRWAAVLGSPIAHSLSPVLHRAAYAALGLADWRYDAVKCDAVGLPGLLAEVRADPEWAGLSLTMPLKTAVLPLLDGLSDVAGTVGAVNTVLPRGVWLSGDNTDVTGLATALAELGRPVPGAGAVVLGGGGTARAVLVALARSGARDVEVVLRRPAAGGALVELGAGVGLQVRLRPWAQAPAAVAEAAVVVATTPAGATDELALTGWPGRAALVDMLYAPWPTALASAARRARVPVVGGLAVLVAQAAAQVVLMTGRPAPVAAMRAAGEVAMRTRTFA